MTQDTHLQAQERELAQQYAELQTQNLSLDLTRGKPAADQLDFGNVLDGNLDDNYQLEDGTDLRNYGVLDGIPSAKRLGAELLDVPQENILVGGNSSLTLMYHTILHGLHIGVRGPGLANKIVKLAADAGVKLTPVGAAYPYGVDPSDSHIRLAPTYPSLDELKKAMQVFVVCVQLASVRQQLKR